MGRFLCGVDKFEPVSGESQEHHAKESFGKLVVERGDGTIDLGLHPVRV